ncbi:HAD family hydrolase [Actibacterium sp. 188UL27-1]|uniref:sulfotransferase-like domain-containing protein n=1 Tax=Actibacterium sp. 188UL27-1 TaxID=2786961 RepID=UPI00351CA757
MKIAMWSGPRNLSTAMMYAFAQRPDCAVVDEPFYGAYLHETGLDHPMKDQIIAGMETDAEVVAAQCSLVAPTAKPIYYQKHMTHHMLPSFPLGWLADVTNVFLIRHPARVVASYLAKRENPKLGELGYVQQIQIYDRCLAMGQAPIVIDATLFRRNPLENMMKICAALNLENAETMLRWRAGGHPSDGIWAKHWYGAVHQSTGFAGPEADLPDLTGPAATLAKSALPFYLSLYEKRLF